MTEKFTWECLWRDSCDGCEVAKFVEDNHIDENDQRLMLDVATATSYRLEAGEAEGDIADDLVGMYGDLSDEGVEVAVRGYVQWQEKGCRDNIRQEEIA